MFVEKRRLRHIADESWSDIEIASRPAMASASADLQRGLEQVGERKLLVPLCPVALGQNYYSMASIVTSYPKVHLTINVTPCLLWQIEGYTERGSTVSMFKPTVRARQVDDTQPHVEPLVPVGGTMAGAQRFQLIIKDLPLNARQLRFHFRYARPNCDCQSVCCAAETYQVHFI